MKTPSGAAAPRPAARNIAVLTTEPLPVAGGVTTGAGLRAWGLAAGLVARGFRVTVASPAGPETPVPAGGGDPAAERVARGDIGGFLAGARPDVVVLQHWGLAADVPDLDVPLVVDLAGPHLLERAYWGSDDPLRDLAEKLDALRRADFVTCSGEFQRRYFLPFLMQAGHDVRADGALPVIPFSVPPTGWHGHAATAPDAPRDGEPVFVYGGTFLAWQDPARAIRILLEELDAAGRGRLLFFGGAHPVIDASGGRFAELSVLLRSHPRVEYRGFTPFHELVAEYARATVALDLMERNPERELAFTTRTMIYLWCGLPVIHDDYSEPGALIRARGCGWALSPDDADGLRGAVRSVLDGTAPLGAMRAAALRLAADHAWDRTIGPLSDFCAAPGLRAGRQPRATATPAATPAPGRTSTPARRLLAAVAPALAPVARLAAWPVARLLCWRLNASAAAGRDPRR